MPPGTMGSASQSSQSIDQTQSPIIPDAWQKNFDNTFGGLGTFGNTPGQQTAQNYWTNQISGPDWQVNAPNNIYRGITGGLPAYANYGAQPFFAASGQVGNVNSTMGQALNGMYGGQLNGLPQAQSSDVNPLDASSKLGQYNPLYQQMVGDPVLNQFDQQTARTLTGMRGARAASSAFGDRADGTDANFLNDANLNREQLAYNLRQGGFNTLAGLAQGDTQNAANVQTSNANRDAAQSLANAQLKAGAQSAYMGGLQNQIANILSGAGLVGAGQGAFTHAADAQGGQQGTAATDLVTGGNTGESQLANLLKIGLATFGSHTQGTQSGSSSSGGFDFTNPLTAALLFA